MNFSERITRRDAFNLFKYEDGKIKLSFFGLKCGLYVAYFYDLTKKE